MVARSDSSPPVNGGFSWVRRDIDDVKEVVKTKADEKYVNAKYETLKDTSDRIRTLAIEAKDLALRPHLCNQQEAIRNMQKSLSRISDMLDKWNTIKIGVVISVILLAAAAVGQWYALNSSVDNTKETVESMESTVNTLATTVHKIDSSSAELQAKLEDVRAKTETGKNEQLDEIKQLLQEAVAKPRGRRVSQ